MEAPMTPDVPGYSPISCDFYDILEAAATTRKVVHVRFLDEEGSLQHRSASIVDVFSRNGAEYLSISTGETVRLDRLIAVDHAKLADY
jgi:Rho-binding antiterminator